MGHEGLFVNTPDAFCVNCHEHCFVFNFAVADWEFPIVAPPPKGAPTCNMIIFFLKMCPTLTSFIALAWLWLKVVFSCQILAESCQHWHPTMLTIHWMSMLAGFCWDLKMMNYRKNSIKQLCMATVSKLSNGVTTSRWHYDAKFVYRNQH